MHWLLKWGHSNGFQQPLGTPAVPSLLKITVKFSSLVCELVLVSGSGRRKTRQHDWDFDAFCQQLLILIILVKALGCWSLTIHIIGCLCACVSMQISCFRWRKWQMSGRMACMKRRNSYIIMWRWTCLDLHIQQVKCAFITAFKPCGA